MAATSPEPRPPVWALIVLGAGMLAPLVAVNYEYVRSLLRFDPLHGGCRANPFLVGMGLRRNPVAEGICEVVLPVVPVNGWIAALIGAGACVVALHGGIDRRLRVVSAVLCLFNLCALAHAAARVEF